MKKKQIQIIIASIFILFITLIFIINQISRNLVVTKRAIHIVATNKNEVQEVKPVEIPINNTQTPIEQPQLNPTPFEQTQNNQPQQEEYITSTEEVYWNVWKSNFLNKFLTDINREGQVPTTFSAQIEFDVNKYREISNCYMGVEPKDFEKLFIKSAVRILKSYQYTDILTFPKNTQRTTKHVTFFLRPNFDNRDYHTRPEQFSKDTEYIKTKRRKY